MPGPETFVGQRRTALFDEQRPRLLGLAYRMLGAVSEAEVVLDVTRVRWSAGYLPEVQDPETALTTLVTRLAMDRMRLIRAARQGYSGFWLPEPVPCRSRDGEPLSLELLAAMERLSPLERAAYVLRVVLARPYPEVAAVSVVGCRRSASSCGGPGSTSATPRHRTRPTEPVTRSSSAGSLRPAGRRRSVPSSTSWGRTSSC